MFIIFTLNLGYLRWFRPCWNFPDIIDTSEEDIGSENDDDDDEKDYHPEASNDEDMVDENEDYIEKSEKLNKKRSNRKRSAEKTKVCLFL